MNQQSQSTRNILCVIGERGWSVEAAAALVRHCEAGRLLWVCDDVCDIPTAVRYKAALNLLGMEFDCVVLDLHSGLNTDVFVAVSGMVLARGTLLLLVPDGMQTAMSMDKERTKILPYGYRVEEMPARFFKRLLTQIEERVVSCVREGDAYAPIIFPPALKTPVKVTPEQSQAVKRIVTGLKNERPYCGLLLAKRGRGKTTVLAWTISHYLETGSAKLVLSTPTKRHCELLLMKVDHALHSRVQFLPADEILRQDTCGEILFIDEAATIPLPMLMDLVSRFKHVVLATTTQGYEGTGKGFELRFIPHLMRINKCIERFDLQQAMRWSAGDHVEAWIDQTFLLASADQVMEWVPDRCGDVEVVRVCQTDLSGDETLLSQVYGLLSLAHYRTRPHDLHILLDAPNLDIWIMKQNGAVSAALLLSREGGIDASLQQAIFYGERRVRGHLIPQALSFYAGVEGAVLGQYKRIIRIAVHPRVQRQGLGSRLLAEVIEIEKRRGVDAFGVSFALSDESLRFWQRQDFVPVYLGQRQGHASGDRSLMMLRPVTDAGRRVQCVAASRLQAKLNAGGYDEEVQTLFAGCSGSDVASGHGVDLERLVASYLYGHRLFETVVLDLKQWLQDPKHQDAWLSLMHQQRDFIMSCLQSSVLNRQDQTRLRTLLAEVFDE